MCSFLLAWRFSVNSGLGTKYIRQFESLRMSWHHRHVEHLYTMDDHAWFNPILFLQRNIQSSSILCQKMRPKTIETLISQQLKPYKFSTLFHKCIKTKNSCIYVNTCLLWLLIFSNRYYLDAETSSKYFHFLCDSNLLSCNISLVNISTEPPLILCNSIVAFEHSMQGGGGGIIIPL